MVIHATTVRRFQQLGLGGLPTRTEWRWTCTCTARGSTTYLAESVAVRRARGHVLRSVGRLARPVSTFRRRLDIPWPKVER